jgi:hypothetical protein
MTRDEAIGKLVNVDVLGPLWSGENGKLIDKLEALGLLKLDAPKAPYEIVAQSLGFGEDETRRLKTTLDMCGYRVVPA